MLPNDYVCSMRQIKMVRHETDLTDTPWPFMNLRRTQTMATYREDCSRQRLSLTLKQINDPNNSINRACIS